MSQGLVAQDQLHQQDLSCPEEIHRIVAERMKDPAATLTRRCQDRTGKGRRIICGEYNGKNSYGAYTGYKPFYVIGENFASAATVDHEQLWSMMHNAHCR